MSYSVAAASTKAKKKVEEHDRDPVHVVLSRETHEGTQLPSKREMTIEM